MSELPVKQLYEKVEGEYIPFNPQIDLNCLLESVTARSIAFIFHHYNFFSCDWTDTAELTRAQVPPQLRRSGLWITYKPDSQTRITERFKGSDLDASVYEKWVDDAYWENLDFELILKAAEAAIKNIFYNIHSYPELYCMLRKWVEQYLGEVLTDEMLEDIIKGILGDDLSDQLKNIIMEYFNTTEFSEYIKTLLEQILSDGGLDEFVEQWLEEHVHNYVTDAVNNYFHTPEGERVLKDALEDIVGDMLDDALQDYFADIQQTLTDMERVIANGLARHEMAITELQNQLTSN